MPSFTSISLLPAFLALAAAFARAAPAGHIGTPTSDVFPPPNATKTTGDGLYFPAESAIGYAGPTPSLHTVSSVPSLLNADQVVTGVAGEEPFVIETSTAQPKVVDYYPLVKSEPLGQSNTSFDMLRSWGNLSPQFSLPDGTFGVSSSPAIPEGCEVEQVHLVHRHGARYPTSTGELVRFAGRLYNVSRAGNLSFSGELSFLNDWEYPLGAEILTPFGRSQLFNMGVGFRTRYGRLLNNFTDAGVLPVFRTTSQDRMYKSAINFAAGFFGLPYEDQYEQSIIIEQAGFNNSLAPYYTCPQSNSEDIGSIADPIVANWTKQYLTHAVQRFSNSVEGYKLTTTDVSAMIQLCSYETVALGYSKFCDLFTEDEFKDYAYSYDLSFWYSNSFGNPTAAALGVGYVSELLAILTQTHTPVYNTSVNSTLASSDITNPLNQSIYVSATHDTVISSIVVALNFTSLASAGPLPTTKRPATQSFHTEQIAPFASQLTGQVLRCPAKGAKQFRFILNDAVVPLNGLGGCPLDDTEGLCPLDTFVQGLNKRVEEIDFAYDCNANYTYSIPYGGGGVTNGRPPL